MSRHIDDFVTGCALKPAPTTTSAADPCTNGAARLTVAQGEMDPTLSSGDDVAFAKFDPSGPRGADIVIVNWLAWTGDAGPNAPERVIGLAGDRVELRDGGVVLNGSVLSEPYLAVGARTDPLPGDPLVWVVPEASVFVLGDGRTGSADSRHYGVVPVAALMGRVIFRCGPLDRRGPTA
jgi:signal peptidase I